MDKILNPVTGRYVLKTGKIGKELLKKQQTTKEKTETVAKKEENTDKKININKLKSEWKTIYNISEISSNFDIIQSKDNLLNIKLSRTQKIIGLTGEGTLILRKIKDIALANRENTEIYLPKNYTGRHFSNPLWNRVHGYMYYINENNIKMLSRIVYTINQINKKYNSYKLSDSLVKEDSKTHGIIGIDIPYIESKWITELVKGNPLQNPILNKEEQIIFSKCAISTKTIEKANFYLQNKMPKEFQILYPKYINLRSTKTVSPQLKVFIESDYKIANIAYDRHARIIFKNNDKLYIIDPWKQSADTGTKNLIKNISNLEFIKRKAEQTNEGSCTAVSYARTLYVTVEGIDKINERIPFDYIVLASRLISKFRT